MPLSSRSFGPWGRYHTPRRVAQRHATPSSDWHVAAVALLILALSSSGCNRTEPESDARAASDGQQPAVTAPSLDDIQHPPTDSTAASNSDHQAPAADPPNDVSADMQAGNSIAGEADPPTSTTSEAAMGLEQPANGDMPSDAAMTNEGEAAEADSPTENSGSHSDLLATAGAKTEAPDATGDTPGVRHNPLRDADNSTEQDAPPKKRFFAKSGKHSGIPFDPIKVNGPIFVDWPKPDLAIVFTGRQDGYLEPCGCAGLDRMKGGLSRRHSFFENLRNTRNWPVVGLDAGGLCKGFGRQAELKFQTTVEAMNKMGYDVIGFGTSDLKFPAAELVSVAASLNDQASPFLSANVGLFGFDAALTERWRVIERGGRKIGVTSVLGEAGRKAINNADIEMVPAAKAVEQVLPELKQRSNLMILLAHATIEESIALARQFPEFDIVVTAGGAPEPPPKPQTIEGTDTLLIEVGEKGMDTIVLGFYNDPKQPMRYQRVPLDSRFDESIEMQQLMLAYQTQLKELGWAGLGIRPVPHPRAETQGRFVGTHKCKDCHEKSYDIWKKTGHAKAYQTLVELEPPRQYDPECVSCHVIGWHPTQYFPYESGYLSLEQTPKMIDVGCENCHGPGENHVKAEMGGDLEAAEKYQKAMIVTKEESEKRQCMTCHDLDNSPDFDFETYWPEVEHYETED